MTRDPFFGLLLLLAACASAPQLHEEDFVRVTHGMTQDEVQKTLGPPWRTEAFARQRQLAWDYTYRDLWGYIAFVSVIFDDTGHVVDRVHTRKEPEDN